MHGNALSSQQKEKKKNGNEADVIIAKLHKLQQITFAWNATKHGIASYKPFLSQISPKPYHLGSTQMPRIVSTFFPELWQYRDLLSCRLEL